MKLGVAGAGFGVLATALLSVVALAAAEAMIWAAAVAVRRPWSDRPVSSSSVAAAVAAAVAPRSALARVRPVAVRGR